MRCGFEMTANRPSATPTVSASPTSRRPPSRSAKWMIEMTLALAEKHGEGIGLFTGTAAGDPESQRPVQRVIAHKVGNNALRQKIENGGIAKEARDIDQ